MERMITSTENFGEAFADMITRILAEIARLKIEQAIIGPLMRMLIPIPEAPGAFPSPTIDPTQGVPDFSISKRLLGNSLVAPGSAQMSNLQGAVVVQQTIEVHQNQIDTRTGSQFLSEHAADIASIVGKGARSSAGLARQLRGRR